MIGLYLLLAGPAVLGGLILLRMAGARRRARLGLRRRASVQVQATVVRALPRAGSINQKSVPHYIYEFPVNGTLHRARGPGRGGLREGDTTPVFYDPNHPEIVCVPEAQPRFGIFALYFIGAVWTLAGVNLFFLGLLGIR